MNLVGQKRLNVRPYRRPAVANEIQKLIASVGPAFEKLIVQGRSDGQAVVGVEAHDGEIPCPTLRNERRLGAFVANLKLRAAKLDACRRETNEAAEAHFNPLGIFELATDVDDEG